MPKSFDLVDAEAKMRASYASAEPKNTAGELAVNPMAADVHAAFMRWALTNNQARTGTAEDRMNAACMLLAGMGLSMAGTFGKDAPVVATAMAQSIAVMLSTGFERAAAGKLRVDTFPLNSKEEPDG